MSHQVVGGTGCFQQAVKLVAGMSQSPEEEIDRKVCGGEKHKSSLFFSSRTRAMFRQARPPSLRRILLLGVLVRGCRVWVVEFIPGPTSLTNSGVGSPGSRHHHSQAFQQLPSARSAPNPHRRSSTVPGRAPRWSVKSRSASIMECKNCRFDIASEPHDLLQFSSACRW